MARYVMFYPGKSLHPDDIDRIAAAPGVTILDATTPRAVLVEATEAGAAWLNANLPGWLVAPETHHSLPHLPRPMPKR